MRRPRGPLPRARPRVLIPRRMADVRDRWCGTMRAERHRCAPVAPGLRTRGAEREEPAPSLTNVAIVPGWLGAALRRAFCYLVVTNARRSGSLSRFARPASRSGRRPRPLLGGALRPSFFLHSVIRGRALNKSLLSASGSVRRNRASCAAMAGFVARDAGCATRENRGGTGWRNIR